MSKLMLCTTFWILFSVFYIHTYLSIEENISTPPMSIDERINRNRRILQYALEPAQIKRSPIDIPEADPKFDYTPAEISSSAEEAYELHTWMHGEESNEIEEQTE